MPDVWLAAYCWPPLTTVEMPLGVMGGRAVDLLAAMVAGATGPSGWWSRPPRRGS